MFIFFLFVLVSSENVFECFEGTNLGTQGFFLCQFTKSSSDSSSSTAVWLSGHSVLFVPRLLFPARFWPTQLQGAICCCFFVFYKPTHWGSVLSLCFIPDAVVVEDKPELNGNQQDNGAIQGTWKHTHTHSYMQSHADMLTNNKPSPSTHMSHINRYCTVHKHVQRHTY